MACEWCGEEHGVDRLCHRAQRGMTRRSFCFLFGAGIIGAAVAANADAPDCWYRDYNGRLHFFDFEDAKFPALKRTGGVLQWRLADDSGPWNGLTGPFIDAPVGDSNTSL